MKGVLLSLIIVGGAFGLAAGWQEAPLTAQTPQTYAAEVREGVLRVSANDVRPLSAAVLAPEDACRCPISYEDPPIRYPADLVDHSAPGMRGRAMVPRGGTLLLSLDLAGRSLRDSVPDVLQRTVEAYEATRYPGRFAIRRDGDHVAVVPASYRTQNGETSNAVQLDTRVSFAVQERTLLATLELINLEQGRFSGSKVVTGMAPTSAMRNRTIILGANDEPARVLLTRVLAALDVPTSWQLLYSHSQRMFALNIRYFQ